jgi:hypothetical protein
MANFKKVYILEDNEIKLGVEVNEEVFCLGFFMSSKVDKNKCIIADTIDDLMKELKDKYELLADTREEVFQDFIKKYENGIYNNNFAGVK